MVDTEVEASLQQWQRQRRSRWRRLLLFLTSGLLALALVAAGVLWARGAYWAPVLVDQTVGASFTVAGPAPALPWPTQGQAYVDVEGVGELGSSGPAGTEVPIASVTKTMTAYQLLRDHPLAAGADGPAIVVTPALFNASKSAELDESGIGLQVGEQLTLRQALLGMLLPSAGNMARLLAAWDAGSVAAFVGRMNAQARSLGLTHTNYADPAGISADSKSTAADQVRLGESALNDPALAELVATKAVRLPVAGVVTNTNRLLGMDGDIGIKTGSTSAAGGCLLFATRNLVGGVPVTVVGAVLGQPGTPWTILDHAETAARNLIEAVQNALVATTVVHSGSTVAVLRQRGHADVALTSAGDVTVVGWPSLGYRVAVSPGRELRVVNAGHPDAVVAAAPLAGH
ncbi:MAG TPA: D-alanyl-D-alanine carboxypeptidase [Actinospica sp.]|nr:D-alanyl-D-alanine carboxypeptidase [Actinospica sp.]